MKNKPFLEEGYEIPKAPSDYMRFEQGENIFRVITPAITGYEYWTNENKPARSELPFEETPDMRDGTLIKHFWAFVVWNVKDERIQILEITQKSIMQAMEALTFDEEWGEIFGYDLKVTREGEKLDTKYTITPRPKKALTKKIETAYDKKPINLKALYKGEDPFEAKEHSEKKAKDIDNSVPFGDNEEIPQITQENPVESQTEGSEGTSEKDALDVFDD